MKFSGKLLDLRIQHYRNKFKTDEGQWLNLSNGHGQKELREELVDDLTRRLNHTSSKPKSLGRIKTSSDGTKYISFF